MDCAYNIITANFSGGKTHATTARVYQWSRGIELCITGADNLPQTFKAHFSVQKRGGVATTVVGIDERVEVPNVLFTIGKDIHVWLGASETEDDAEILYTVDIPVAPAPMPEYYDAEDTGVFDEVVEQVSGYAATATAAANSAGASATAAAGSASAAAASASSAAGSAGTAEQARANAVTAKGQAETAAQTATEKALQTAQNASQAALDAGRAESAAERAESAEAGAGAAKTAAEAAAQSAAASAATADEKASLAGQSATAAAGSASEAAQSAASIEGDVQTATQKAAEAQTAAGQAVTAKDAAVTAQQGAETAATNAGQSASTATTKAAEAATSASNAAASESAAEAAATRAEQAAASLTVDDELSSTSTNPVQNQVITAELTDVKTAIDALKIVDTASGAIASFPDGAAMPVEGLSVEMEPIQDLNGQANPYPAGGGKNLYNKDGKNTENGYESGRYLNSSGSVNSNSAWDISEYIPVSANTQYTLSNVNGSNPSIAYYDSNKTLLSSEAYKDVSPKTITTPANTAYVRLSVTVATEDTVQFEPGSSATSYAPYSNICPITGRDAVTVTRTGINVFDKSEVVDGAYINDGDGAERQSADSKATGWISVVPGEKYYILTEQTMGALGAWYDKNKDFIGKITGYLPSGGQKEQTAPSNAAYMRLTCYRSDSGNIDTFAVNYPSTDHDYHAYDGQSVTIQLGQTVYGGTVDVTTGMMTVTDAMVDLGSQTWGYQSTVGYFYTLITNPLRPASWNTVPHGLMSDRYATVIPNKVADASMKVDNGISIVPNSDRLMITNSAYTDAASFKTAMSGAVVVYKLATPLTIRLTPEQMTTLKGTNNVWSDADSVSVEYVADPKLYIARLTEPDADMVADANIVNGQYFMVGNTLYLATAKIASGAAITPGVNCTRTNLAAALNAINA